MYQDVDLCPQDEAQLAAVLDLGAETVEGLGRLRQDGALLDLTIKVGDHEFKVSQGGYSKNGNWRTRSAGELGPWRSRSSGELGPDEVGPVMVYSQL